MKMRHLGWLILALLFFSTVINYIDRETLSVLEPLLRNHLGITSFDYGLVTTVFLVGYTGAQLFAGILIDSVGTRVGFAVSLVIWSIAEMGHALVHGLKGLLGLRFILSLGEAGNWPAGTKAIAEWFPPQARAFAMGFFDGGSALGAVVALPLVAAVTVNLSWRAAFVVTGSLGFLLLIPWVWIYQEPSKHRWLALGEKAKAVKTRVNEKKKPSFQNMLRILRIRQSWGLIMTRMLATPVWWFYVFWLPDYLSKGRGLSLKEIGAVGWIPFATADLGKLVGGVTSDWLLRHHLSPTLARKGVMVAAAVAMLSGTRVVGARTGGEAIGWISLATFGFGMWSANILALHADIFPSRMMATVVGLTGMAAGLGGAVFTFFTGWLVGRSGYVPVFWAVGLIALVALIFLLFLVGRVETPACLVEGT